MNFLFSGSGSLISEKDMWVCVLRSQSNFCHQSLNLTVMTGTVLQYPEEFIYVGTAQINNFPQILFPFP